MPYLGNIPASNFSSIAKDTFSGNGSTTAFTLSKQATTNGVAVYVENVRQIPTTAYSVSGTTLTFASAPTGAITVGFNSEIDVINDVTLPSEISLAANGSAADTGFQVDTTLYNVAIIDYTLESTSGVRIGQIRIGTDVSGGTSTIADNYTETTVVGITFSVDIATANTMKLKYTDADNKICKFKYTYQLWNSN